MLTKTFLIPPKSWFNVKQFLVDFPELKLSLFLAIHPFAQYSMGDLGGTGNGPTHAQAKLRVSGYNSQFLVGSGNIISQSEKYKRLLVHKNRIRYALSKSKPLTYYSYINPSYGNFVDYTWIDNNVGSQKRTTIMPDIHLKTIADYIPSGTKPGSLAYGMPLVPYNKTVAGGNSGPNQLPYSWFVVNKFLYPEEYAYLKMANRAPETAAYVNTYWSNIVNYYMDIAIADFQAYSMDDQVIFNDTFDMTKRGGKGETNKNKVLPYTINYSIAKDPPPVPDNVWQDVNFWSNLFEKPEMRALLQASTELFPVKVTTNAFNNWSGPSSLSITANQDGNITTTQHIYKYIISNFKIDVTADNKIMVSYYRDKRTETFTFIKDSTKTWRDYVGYVILGVTVAANVVGLAAGIMAMPGITGAGVPSVASSSQPVATSSSYITSGMGSQLTAPIGSIPSYIPAQATLMPATSAVSKASSVLRLAKPTGNGLSTINSVSSKAGVSNTVKALGKLTPALSTKNLKLVSGGLLTAGGVILKDKQRRKALKGSYKPVTGNYKQNDSSSLKTLGILGAVGAAIYAIVST